jgi:SAM-dependent methyltransferase
MHFTEYWSILERDHTIQNPTSPEKLMLLADYCGAHEGARVLDIGCGKGWLLRNWARAFAIAGTGIEVNPAFIAEAHVRAAEEDLAAHLTFIEGAALDIAVEPQSYDIALCIGASFALGGFDPALDWMRRAVRPGGTIAIGEPYAIQSSLPPELQPDWGESLRDLPGLVDALEQDDLTLTGMILASPDDWDRYVSLHWRAALEWAELNPDHPDRLELVQRVVAGRESYLRWERQAIGWGIFVARA